MQGCVSLVKFTYIYFCMVKCVFKVLFPSSEMLE